MVLAMPVLHPSLSGHVLLRPGFELDRPALARLVDLRIGSVWIHYPELESVIRYSSPEVVYAHQDLTATMGRALDKLRDLRDHKHAELDFQPYMNAIRSVIAKLIMAPDAAVLVHDLVNTGSPLAMHSGNVCFLSLLLGLKLEHYLVEQRRKVAPQHARNVENLGLGALLHDIGMARIRPEVVERWIKTGDETDPAYQAHVRIGYDLVRDKLEATASAGVLQHHQRYDGRGFPKLRQTAGAPIALAGEQIHIFARIITVADLYDQLRNPPIGRGREDARQPVVRVLSTLLKAARERTIDPIVFKALLQVVPAFAPGTIVRLSDGRMAVVLEFDPLNPCRPLVRHLLHMGFEVASDEQYLGEIIDLTTKLQLSVIESEGQDVTGDLFEANYDAEFDLRVLKLPKPPAPAKVTKKTAVERAPIAKSNKRAA